MAKRKGTLKLGDLSPTSPFSRFELTSPMAVEPVGSGVYYLMTQKIHSNLAPAIAADAYDIYMRQQYSLSKQITPFCPITGVDFARRTIYNRVAHDLVLTQTGVIQ